MRTDRLLKLADYLETVVSAHPESFDMGYWGINRTCGTSCCALGHACSIPEFQEAGLRLVWDSEDDTADVTIDGDEEIGDYEDGFFVAERFFDITADDANQIFAMSKNSSGTPSTPRDVAARIRQIVARDSGTKETSHVPAS